MFDDQTVPVTWEDCAVMALMDRGEEAAQRRRRVKEYGVKAHRAMEKGGSSYERLAQLIESFKQRDASVTP
jgi:UDP-glucosyltransferase 73C